MTEQDFDPEIQTRRNGPLTPDFQKRIVSAKEKHRLGYWDIANFAGFSGSFLGNITRYENNVGTPYATRLRGVIEKLEAAAERSDVASLFPASSPAPEAEVAKPVTLTLAGVLAAAKKALADTVGVKPEAIEITIRA